MSTTRSIGSFEVIQSFFPFHHNSIIFSFTNQKQTYQNMKFTLAVVALCFSGVAAFAPAPAGRATTVVFNEGPEM